ncbi:hypothetical protein HYFRA_00013851 [Hymenoscyphus fraxineus]|uniref:Uncharacterized protein n=1 Tax=Hymenoscyphus fraxineus TaxID=746836 RepID=A0A9N9LAH2_9HELO|nr:hypothetical protein HYFRA_00013851 [Hymenoscyphus fraxineus]
MKFLATLPIVLLFTGSALAKCAKSDKSASGPNTVCEGQKDGMTIPYTCTLAGEFPFGATGSTTGPATKCSKIKEDGDTSIHCVRIIPISVWTESWY